MTDGPQRSRGSSAESQTDPDRPSSTARCRDARTIPSPVPSLLGRRHRRRGRLGHARSGPGARAEARADLPQLEPLRPRLRRRAAQAGGGLRQAGQLHGARGHHRPPPAARQVRGRGGLPVRPRHDARQHLHGLPLRAATRRRGRRGRRPGQAVRWLVPVLERGRPDVVGLEGGAVVLDLLPGHLQHGALQEGRVRDPEDLGRAAQAGQGPQEAGQPRGHPHQPLRRRQHHLLVGAVVQRGQGPGGRRQDAGPQLRQDRPGDRVVQGALQGRHGVRRCCRGTTPPTTASCSPARAPGFTTRSAPTTRPSPRACPSPTTSITTGARPGRPGSTPPRPSTGIGIWKFSKNADLAKEFIKFHFQKENFDAWIVASNAFNHPPLRHFADHPIWAKNPKFAMLPGGGGVRSPARLAGQDQRRGEPDRGELRAARHGGQGRRRHADEAGHGLGRGSGRSSPSRASSRPRARASPWPSASGRSRRPSSPGPDASSACGSGGSRSTSSATG